MFVWFWFTHCSSDDFIGFANKGAVDKQGNHSCAVQIKPKIGEECDRQPNRVRVHIWGLPRGHEVLLLVHLTLGAGPSKTHLHRLVPPMPLI